MQNNLRDQEIVLYEPKSHESKWLRFFMVSIGSFSVLSYFHWKDLSVLIIGSATILYGAYPFKDRRKISIHDGFLNYQSGFFGNLSIKIDEIETIEKQITVDNESSGAVSVKTYYKINMVTGKTEYIPHVFASDKEAIFEEYFEDKLR